MNITQEKTMKQTAVEWLLENLISEPHFEKDFNYNSECWDKAKAMEKEQIGNAYVYGAAYGINLENGLSPNNYYTETYESNT